MAKPMEDKKTLDSLDSKLAQLIDATGGVIGAATSVSRYGMDSSPSEVMKGLSGDCETNKEWLIKAIRLLNERAQLALLVLEATNTADKAGD